MIRCRNSLLPFLVLAAFLSISAEGCNRTCGHNSVPYPFGFSPDCPIRLNCNKTNATLGGYYVKNITNESILVDIPADCHRGVGAVQSLFGENYAMRSRNGLFLRNCTSSILSICSISTELISERLDLKRCGGKGDNISCYTNERMIGYLSKKNISELKCESLFISLWYTGANANQPELGFGEAELGWWMNGECRCSANAACSSVETSVPGKRGYTCACHEGFTGDGFVAGDSCKKGIENSGNLTNNLKKEKIIIGVLAIVGGFPIVVGLSYGCLFLFTYVHHHRKSYSKDMQNAEDFLQKYGSMVPKRYKYLEIKKMTNSFSQKIGQGGYGSVFKGNLYDGHLVAVKVLSESKGNVEEFINEVASIGKTSHVNIVCLLGFCLEGSKRALVYEFMPNGSLEKFIYEETINAKIKLGWEKLYEIAVGIARGLEYLHCRCNTRIVHFDIKPHNILLDQDFCPKISDFGLAKLCPSKESIISMVGARGTVGFIAPEVFYRNFGIVSSKSDVYSYGMMVLEMAGGRRNIDARAENTSEIYFPHWIYDHLQQSNALETCGVSSETEDIAKKMILVGLWCIQVQPTDRPSMSKVVDMLEGSVNDLQMPPKP